MWSGIKLYLLVLLLFLVIDLIWLGVLMTGFYKGELGAAARLRGEALAPIWGAALLVYLLIPLGIVVFVVPQVAAGQSAALGLAWGALYGLILYGVYDLTNYSLLRDWSLRLTLVDIGWGCFICAVTSYGAVLLRQRWGLG